MLRSTSTNSPISPPTNSFRNLFYRMQEHGMWRNTMGRVEVYEEDEEE